MSAEMFRFKRFEVHQERTAMKVGTDGVLLGAWAESGTVTVTGGHGCARRVLDVGCGTGLIALMMAQRYADADILAIDIDEDACSQARENVERSEFRSRVEVRNVPLQRLEGEECYDAIVSNPPFFNNSLKAPDKQRSLARHTDTLPFAELMEHSSRLLKKEGVLSIIVPADAASEITGEAAMAGLFLQRKVMVKTTPRKTAKRCLLAFGKHTADMPENTEVCLNSACGERSGWYELLTKDFYL